MHLRCIPSHFLRSATVGGPPHHSKRDALAPTYASLLTALVPSETNICTFGACASPPFHFFDACSSVHVHNSFTPTLSHACSGVNLRMQRNVQRMGPIHLFESETCGVVPSPPHRSTSSMHYPAVCKTNKARMHLRWSHPPFVARSKDGTSAPAVQSATNKEQAKRTGAKGGWALLKRWGMPPAPFNFFDASGPHHSSRQRGLGFR